MQKSVILEYIEHCEILAKPKLTKLYETIKKVASNASEKISYGMPTFYLNGNLVHFASYKNHIGFYPTPSAITAFKDDLKTYKTSKGAVQFLLSEPIPFALIKKMVLFRVKENLKQK